MIRAVFDCNVVMAGIGWRSEAYRCPAAVARRRVRAFASAWILEEYRRTAEIMANRGDFPHDVSSTLEWWLSACREVLPAPLGKRRSRDPRDDPYLACALSAQTEFIISRDPHLLNLRRPFGIEIVTPRTFLSRLASR